MKKYDVAAYIWPAYAYDARASIFWPEGNGEWQTVKSARPYYEGHRQPRVPLLGYQDESDPAVMEQQIELAAQHGINVFIYDWYCYDGMPFLESCLNNGYLKAKNNSKVNFYLMWANHDVNFTWDKRLSDKMCGKKDLIWKGCTDFNGFKKIAVRLIEEYLKQPSYYKIDGCPVFCIYDLANLINGLGGIDETIKALDWLRKEAVLRGLKGLHLQAILKKAMLFSASGVAGDNNDISKDDFEKLSFDSATHYQYIHYISPAGKVYGEVVKEAFKYMEQIAKCYKTPYCPHVSVGWDSSPRFENRRGVEFTENTPQEVEKAFAFARKFIDDRKTSLPLITVNSWNEWTESSYLLPDKLYGYGYLKAAKKVFLDKD